MCLSASLALFPDTVMALTSYTDQSLVSQRKSQGFLSIEVRVVVQGRTDWCYQDLVQDRQGQTVNPWLSRWVVLCKDGQGKVGLRVSTYNKGVFVVLVVPGSPAAMAGLKFGDQLLTLGRTELAGRTADCVHCLLRRCSVNNIVLGVRDRPLARSLLLHKDRAGRLGVKVKAGRVAAIAVNSSAARQGVTVLRSVILI